MTKDGKRKNLPKGITRRSNGTYMARFSFEGQRYTLYGDDVDELESKMNDMRYEVKHGLYMKETDITVEDWFNTWMNEYKKNSVKYGTFLGYQRVYDLYIKRKLGKRRLTGIRPEHIQHIYNGLNADGYSEKTISLVSVVLGGMFKQAYKNQMILRNPVECASLPKKKRKKGEFRVMTVDEQKLFMKYAESVSPYYRLYVVAIGTGMRSGELRALEWEDVDFTNRLVHVTGTLKFRKEEGYFKDSPKSASSDREIPMLDEVYNILKEQRKEQMENRLKLGTEWQPPEGLENLVFTSPYHRKGYGVPIGDAALNVDLKKIVKQMNADGISFDEITPHTLRHTFATRGLENGIPPKVMQELLGHTSITMTMDIYSHVLPDTKASEIQKIANMF